MQAALIGLATGLSIITFKTLISVMETYTYGNFLTSALNAFGSGKPLSLAMAAIPALGGVCVGVIREAAREFPPGLSGQAEEVDKQKPLDVKRAVLKSLAAVATLGTGCSLGPEGPAVELGVVASRLVTLKASLEQRKQLLLAGAAAGVAAGFNAPIAGVFFALEIASAQGGGEGGGPGTGGGALQKSTLASILLAAVVSALVARVGLKEELALRPAPYLLSSPLVELPGYLGLGVLSGLVALSFRYLCGEAEHFFTGTTRWPAWNFMGRVPRAFKPMLGGALCGLTGILFPQILFFGYETLDGLIANQSYPALLLLGLLALKAGMTALCLASGLVGGLFAPSLFLGATAGAAYQKLLNLFLQASGLAATVIPIAGPPAYAMVGAASVLASMFRAPLTGSLLLFELTRDYDILLPLMASAGMGSLLVELVERKRKVDEVSARKGGREEGGEGGREGGREGGWGDRERGREWQGSLPGEGGWEGGQGLEEGVVLAGVAMAGGGRAEQYIYTLETQDVLAAPPIILGPETGLEDTVLRLCAAKAEVVVVTEGGEKGGDEGSLVGLAVLRDLVSALELWCDDRRAEASAPVPGSLPPGRFPPLSEQGGFPGKTTGRSGLPSWSVDKEMPAPDKEGKTDPEVATTSLTQAVGTASVVQRALALAAVIREMEWSTGLRLRDVVPAIKETEILRFGDEAFRARDLLTTRGLGVVPVVRERVAGGDGGGKGGVEVMGVVDLVSIRAAVARKEAVEMVSRSLLDGAPHVSPSTMGREGGDSP
ncbi:hypothetical protein NSK_004728 [Nannochloropsis salina CCMP1776]|jgi:H+/Cl- antiporter ClcA|uniref:Chloride channel protein n=1 Tax=Nannochloropsis salina CCMP1776 TaxID=1027361 RepID=A0A4D9CYP4_9STRA|nr:hypothetical protein NSK_004728 [Nannochloropsis salina CCMP1776]|eukprot:TFJ83624.1 hypothetical protein NSK_004728 [Nannochloropsis salina CCMP1776]